MTPDLVIDALGQTCPAPVITLARGIADADVPTGAVVALLADDSAVAFDFPSWCALRGHTDLGKVDVLDDGRGPAYLLRVGG